MSIFFILDLYPILDLPRHSSSTEALETLEWKPLYLRRKYHRCISVFKCLNHLVDFDFNHTMISHIHSHRLGRQNNNYYLPRPRTNWRKQQFTYHSVSEWNSLPIELKQSTNLKPRLHYTHFWHGTLK
jgi:hypothetical protein